MEDDADEVSHQGLVNISPDNLMVWEQCQEISRSYHAQKTAIFSFGNRPWLNWNKEVLVKQKKGERVHLKIRYCMPSGRKIRSRKEVEPFNVDKSIDTDLLDFSMVNCLCHEKNNGKDYLECRIGTGGCNKLFHAECVCGNNQAMIDTLRDWQTGIICPLCVAVLDAAGEHTVLTDTRLLKLRALHPKLNGSEMSAETLPSYSGEVLACSEIEIRMKKEPHIEWGIEGEKQFVSSAEGIGFTRSSLDVNINSSIITGPGSPSTGSGSSRGASRHAQASDAASRAIVSLVSRFGGVSQTPLLHSYEHSQTKVPLRLVKYKSQCPVVEIIYSDAMRMASSNDKLDSTLGYDEATITDGAQISITNKTNSNHFSIDRNGKRTKVTVQGGWMPVVGPNLDYIDLQDSDMLGQRVSSLANGVPMMVQYSKDIIRAAHQSANAFYVSTQKKTKNRTKSEKATSPLLLDLPISGGGIRTACVCFGYQISNILLDLCNSGYCSYCYKFIHIHEDKSKVREESRAWRILSVNKHTCKIHYKCFEILNSESLKLNGGSVTAGCIDGTANSNCVLCGLQGSVMQNISFDFDITIPNFNNSDLHLAHPLCIYWAAHGVLSNEISCEEDASPSQVGVRFNNAFNSWRCALCSVQCGITVKCLYPSCCVRVHPICGEISGWLVCNLTSDNVDNNLVDKVGLFCFKHSNL